MSGFQESPWIAEFDKQLRRQKHVLLYGNVHDQSLFRGGYVLVAEFLNAYFHDQGFDVVARYDPVDGIVFPGDPDAEVREASNLPTDPRERFNALVRQRVEADLVGGDPLAPQRPSASPDPGQDFTTPPPRPTTPPPRGPRQSSHAGPDEAFAQFRIALASPTTSCAFVVDLADILTHSPDRYSSEERRSLALLKKCMLEARVQSTGFRNTLVVVASDLKRIPDWLYQDNPYLALVHVSRPTRDERKAFALNFVRPAPDWHGFYGGGDLSDSDLLAVAEEFADLTDGMQSVDLNALRIASHTERIPVRRQRVRSLVDYFKFGMKEDPWEKLSRERVREASAILARRVIGQPAAVEAAVSMLTTSKVGLTMAGGSQSGKPKGVFFFVGPTGVGKTELAKAMTELVFGDERAFARFDMSEYKEEHAAEKLAGAPPGFVGYEQGGQLTERVMRQPHSILLFDEIEKAHPRVLDKFLQILEDGRLTDGKGQTAYFNQTAIIFTSNIGASDSVQSDGSLRRGIMPIVRERGVDQFAYNDVREFFKEEVRHFFTTRIARAELLSRLGENIIVFDLLRPEYARAIGDKFLRQLRQCAEDKFGLNLTFDDSVLHWIERAMRVEENLLLGGRRIKSLLEEHVERPLNGWLFANIDPLDSLRGGTLLVSLGEDGELAVARTEV